MSAWKGAFNMSGPVNDIIVEDSILPEQVETKLLLKTDCPVPCDFIVYNISDWDECAEDDCSFAYRVENGGDRLYVKE